MQPRSLQQILGELDTVYSPQLDTIRQRQASIPGQIQAEEQGLQAKQENAFGDIVGGARRRGLGFSGIPMQEQAKYTATEYLPAIARLRQSGREQAMSLEDSITGINQQKMQLAQGYYQNDQSIAEQRRQFEENLRAQREAASGAGGGGFMPTMGGGEVAPTAGNPKSASMVKRADGGFNYTDAKGRPISAAAFAVLRKTNIRDVLAEAAKAGDKGAQTALGFIGADGGYDPRKVNNKGLADLYNSLMWGTGRQASFGQPAAKPAPARPASFQPVTTFGGFKAPLAGR